MNVKNLALIPARGGSKRIPNKNIKDFFGKPIIAYSIETALKTNIFDDVIVSTDSKEIAEIASYYGARVPFFRSNENAGDHATLADVIKEVVITLEQENIFIENICCLLATVPLITEARIMEGCEQLINTRADAVIPVIAFSYPIWRSFKLSEENKLSMIWPEYMNSRSQDLPKAFHDAGAFYWIRKGAFIEQEKLFMAHTSALVLKENEVQDIDTIEDWKMAELKYKLLHEQ
jgi:N-acylneuraminate cytidylyltransferase